MFGGWFFFLGSGSSGGPVFYAGFREVTGLSSATSNMETLSRPFILMRYVRHQQSSWMAPQNLPRGAPDCMVHLWRAQASATISSYFTTLMSQQPWNDGGRKSPHFNPARQGGASHEPLFFVGSWISGRLQLVFSPGPAPAIHRGSWYPCGRETRILATNLVSPHSSQCMLGPIGWCYLVGGWWAFGLSPSLGSYGLLGWVTVGVGVMDEGAGVPRASNHSVGSSDLRVPRHSWGDVVASWASCGSSSSWGERLPPLGFGRFWVHCPLAPGAKPPLSCPHLDTSKVHAPLKLLCRIAKTPEGAPNLSAHCCSPQARAGFFPV